MSRPHLRWLYGTDEPSLIEVVVAAMFVVLLVLLVGLLVLDAASPWTEVVEIAFYASLATVWVLSFRRRRASRSSPRDEVRPARRP